MDKFITNNFSETQMLGQDLAAKLLAKNVQKTAVVLALSGDLGAGKTTFLQGFAKGLKITENILSPTFVIMKSFKLQTSNFKNFYHLDCYRLHSPEEIMTLGFADIISNPENIVAIEWPEKLGRLLPKDIITITFKHLQEHKRNILIENF